MKKILSIGILSLIILVLGGCTIQINNSPITNDDTSTQEDTSQNIEQTTRETTETPTKIEPTNEMANQQKIHNGIITQVAEGDEYINKDLAFSMVLPDNYFVTWEGSGGANTHIVDISTYDVAPQREYKGIRIKIQPFSRNIEEFVQERIELYSEENRSDVSKVDLNKTTVDRQPAYVVGQNTYIMYNNKLFSFNNGLDSNIFEYILDTFTFLD